MVSVAALPQEVLAVGGQPGTLGHPGQGVITTLPRTPAGFAPPQQAQSPRPGMLWWVHALGPSVAWLAGENGTVLRRDESAGLQIIPTPTSAVLYGIWAFSDQDVWAVGGDDGQPGVVLHGGLGGLALDATLPTSGTQCDPVHVGTLFKIYGADPDHLFVSGACGVLLRRQGGRWLLDPPLVGRAESLTTVHGRGAADVYAVGGSGHGRVLHWDGTAWSLLDTPELGGLSGVVATPAQVLITGEAGLLASATGAAPFQVAAAPTMLDLHAAAALGEERFAAGGNLSQFGLQPPRGVLLHQAAP